MLLREIHASAYKRCSFGFRADSLQQLHGGLLLRAPPRVEFEFGLPQPLWSRGLLARGAVRWFRRLGWVPPGGRARPGGGNLRVGRRQRADGALDPREMGAQIAK